MNNEQKNKRNTSYSRNGCLQCKKSHRKCDEAVPFCQNCTKRNKLCQYKENTSLRLTLPLPEHIPLDAYSGGNGVSVPPLARTDGLSSMKSDSLMQTTNIPIMENFKGFSNSNSPNNLLNMNTSSYGGESLSTNSSNNENFNQFWNTTSSENGQAPELPKVYAVITSWKTLSWEDSFRLIVDADVIENYDNETTTVARTIEENKVSTLQQLDEFVLIVGQWLLLSEYFTLIPYSEAVEVANSIRHFALKYPVVKNTIKLLVAIYLSDAYEVNGFVSRSIIWSEKIGVPLSKKCVEHVSASMNNRKECFYENDIALILSLALLLPLNIQDPSSNWKAHMVYIHASLLNARILRVATTTEHPNSYEATIINEFLESWFIDYEVRSQIGSDFGGILDNNLDYVITLPFPHCSSMSLITQHFNLFNGCSMETQAIMKQLANEIANFRKRDINLSGMHIIKTKLTNKDPIVTALLNESGKSIIEGLRPDEEYDTFDQVWNSQWENEIFSHSKDYKLLYSIKYIDRLTRFFLESYARYFLLRESAANSSRVVELLERILRVWYSIPYTKLMLKMCILPMFFSTLISILIGNAKLESHFLEILDDLSKKGFITAAESVERIKKVKHHLLTKDYDGMTDSNY